jgi:hypothetical protein
MVDVEQIEFGAFKVYDPKVTVRNNILPPLVELQNCTTCHRGRRLPADAMSDDDYHYRCTWDSRTHIGLKHYDNDCGNYVRKKEGINK